jgi:predicted DNA-binding transcriptional regulator AlpA
MYTQSDLIPFDEAARIAGITRAGLYKRLRTETQVPQRLKYGRRVYLPRAEFLHWQDARIPTF